MLVESISRKRAGAEVKLQQPVVPGAACELPCATATAAKTPRPTYAQAANARPTPPAPPPGRIQAEQLPDESVAELVIACFNDAHGRWPSSDEFKQLCAEHNKT